jgi:hypothetical protein
VACNRIECGSWDRKTVQSPGAKARSSTSLDLQQQQAFRLKTGRALLWLLPQVNPTNE